MIGGECLYAYSADPFVFGDISIPVIWVMKVIEWLLTVCFLYLLPVLVFHQSSKTYYHSIELIVNYSVLFNPTVH